ncbi:MAG: response regulator transcription factor [Pirellulaceae bacterium]
MRVLLVEDEPDLASTIAQALREAGYAVDIATDGQQAIEKASSWEYDCLVLDLMLPKLSGQEVLRRVRMERSTPVLILSARDTLADRVSGLDLGADDYLVKPFSLTELLARLRALIRRAAGQSQSVVILEALGMEVDLAKRRIARDGAIVPLTAREFALVAYLVLHRGKVVSRTELYDHLFDEEDDTLSNLLDVHVSHIRKKLGADTIVTHRGQGYSIDG